MTRPKAKNARARRIREMKKNRWCWACVDWMTGTGVEPCASCVQHGRASPSFKLRRIGRDEQCPK